MAVELIVNLLAVSSCLIFTTGSGYLLRLGYFCFAKEKTAVKGVIFHVARNGFEETEMAKPTKETILG